MFDDRPVDEDEQHEAKLVAGYELAATGVDVGLAMCSQHQPNVLPMPDGQPPLWTPEQRLALLRLGQELVDCVAAWDEWDRWKHRGLGRRRRG